MKYISKRTSYGVSIFSLRNINLHNNLRAFFKITEKTFLNNISKYESKSKVNEKLNYSNNLISKSR